MYHFGVAGIKGLLQPVLAASGTGIELKLFGLRTQHCPDADWPVRHLQQQHRQHPRFLGPTNMAFYFTATTEAARASRGAGRPRALVIAAIVLATLFAILAARQDAEIRQPVFSVTVPFGTSDTVNREPPVVVEPQAYKPLTSFDAVTENTNRPLDGRRLEVALPFVLTESIAGQSAWDRAVNCLALANYYEAASEGLAGMRAVSQVVLNRVRHPAFPHSVCEVVFQGSDRPTGCQFTFTCDGSLGRSPIVALFDRARAVATEALRGRVEATIGTATHYHANTVVPYWADSLDKIRTVGSHIFYTWRGASGNRSSFRAAYTGERDDPAIPVLTPLAVVDGNTTPAKTLFLASGPDPITLARTAPKGQALNRAFLVADESSRSLKVDEGGTAGTLRAQPLLALPSEKVLTDDR